MSLQGKTTMLDDFKLFKGDDFKGENEMEPTSRMTFSTLLREVWDTHCRTGDHLCL